MPLEENETKTKTFHDEDYFTLQKKGPGMQPIYNEK